MRLDMDMSRGMRVGPKCVIRADNLNGFVTIHFVSTTPAFTYFASFLFILVLISKLEL